MTATQSELAGLSRFVFRTPSPYVTTAFAFLVAAAAGVAAFESGETAGWRGLLVLGQDAWEGIFFIGIPTVVAAVATTGIDRTLGGRLTYGRSSLLALVCEVLVVVIVTGAGAVATLTPLGQRFVFDALIIALASIFALRLLVVMAVSRSSLPVAAIPASVQTVVAAVMLFVYSGTLRFMEVGGPLLRAYLLPWLARAEQAPPELATFGPDHFGLLAVTCVLYAVGVYAFIRVVDRPWRRSLGVSLLDFLRGFVGHVAEGSRELEEFFEELGQEAVVPVTVLAFRRRDGTEKARFVLPMLHPGPMAEIGGGNLPERIAERTDGLAFPPHATAGHDFNLVTRREVQTVLDVADRAHDRIEYAGAATPSVREASGEAKLLGQAFGTGALMVNTYAPNFTDDIEYSVGLAAVAEARTGDVTDVLLVDAHNCNRGLGEGYIPHVTPGSSRAFDLIDAASAASDRLADAARHPVELGTAWTPTEWGPTDGIGPLGVRVAVTRVADQETAYVLIDGNNMEPGLRDRLVGALDGVDAAEVMTTDTHVVNSVDAENQVGQSLPSDELVALVCDLVAEARDDLEPVEAGIATEKAEVTVFGNDRTEMLASHANAAISMGGAFAGAVILLVFSVSLLIFFLT